MPLWLIPMPMPSYPIYCYTKGCKNEAAYKIAGIWSDGVQRELKTYGLVCADCLPAWFRKSRDKQKACRLTTSESLEPPGVYHLEHGRRDQQLHRLEDVEQRLADTSSFLKKGSGEEPVR